MQTLSTAKTATDYCVIKGIAVPTQMKLPGKQNIFSVWRRGDRQLFIKALKSPLPDALAKFR